MDYSATISYYAEYRGDIRSVGRKVLLCDFGYDDGMTEIEFLGHIINKHERKLLPSRTQKVLDLAPPRTPKQVRTFLGLCNAFKDYIPGFSLMQKRFSKLTSKEAKFDWTSQHEEQFHQTKMEIKNASAIFHVTCKDPGGC